MRCSEPEHHYIYTKKIDRCELTEEGYAHKTARLGEKAVPSTLSEGATSHLISRDLSNSKDNRRRNNEVWLPAPFVCHVFHVSAGPHCRPTAVYSYWGSPSRCQICSRLPETTGLRGGHRSKIFTHMTFSSAIGFVATISACR